MGNSINKYIVYMTVNMQNKKFYIGVHKTDTPYTFDDYLGCGSYVNNASTYNKGKFPLHAAILKHGPKSFIRYTLQVFDTEQEALDLEKTLVTEEFIKRIDTYNATIGGGMPPLTNKEVFQFDIKGTLLKKWSSETEIINYYQVKVSMPLIIKNKRSFAGSLWSFSKEINPNEYQVECNHGFISQYTLAGDLVEQFKNTTLASKKLGIKRETITMAVSRKIPFRDFYFLKSDVDIFEVISNKYNGTAGKYTVYRYLENGVYDECFSSILKASKSVESATTTTLQKSILKGTLYKGYYWSFIKGDNYFNIENPCYKPVYKVAQYDLDMNLIKYLDSIKECKKEFPFAQQVCNGMSKTTCGYIFKYIDTKDIV